MSTEPQVYIIESMPKDSFPEGKILHEILTQAGLKPIFKQCSSSSDFKACLQDFQNQRYRFLHISCHGIGKYIDFSDGEHVPYDQFAQLFKEIPFEVSRIFFSTCGSGNSNLVEEIFKVTRSFYSFVGPRGEIDYEIALAMWNTFYTLMYKKSSTTFTDNNLLELLDAMSKLFKTELHVCRYNTAKAKLEHYQFPHKILPYKSSAIKG